jgi:DNA-binding LytR/AlgR family response regulator
MKIQCLLVDDEPMARGVLRRHLARLDAFAVAGECANAFEAINALQSSAVDVLFLDIQMPEMSGLDLLRTLSRPPAVVLTTAFADYALPSYDFNVVDYLLKPIAFERLLKTTHRLLERLAAPPPAALAPPRPPPAPVGPEELFLKSDKKIYKIALADICYLQGWGNYVRVFTRSQGVILPLQTLAEFELLLPPADFIRVHKSYLVARQHMRVLDGNRLLVGDEEIPVGLTYRHRLAAWRGRE